MPFPSSLPACAYRHTALSRRFVSSADKCGRLRAPDTGRPSCCQSGLRPSRHAACRPQAFAHTNRSRASSNKHHRSCTRTRATAAGDLSTTRARATSSGRQEPSQGTAEGQMRQAGCDRRMRQGDCSSRMGQADGRMRWRRITRLAFPPRAPERACMRVSLCGRSRRRALRRDTRVRCVEQLRPRQTLTQDPSNSTQEHQRGSVQQHNGLSGMCLVPRRKCRRMPTWEEKIRTGMFVHDASQARETSVGGRGDGGENHLSRNALASVASLPAYSPWKISCAGDEPRVRTFYT
jgi:hypothetical protein